MIGASSALPSLRAMSMLALGGERVSAEHSVRPALLDAAVDDQHRRLALFVMARKSPDKSSTSISIAVSFR